ncbi:MAG: DUF3015 family protein [Gemmatimonadota bacterium]
MKRALLACAIIVVFAASAMAAGSGVARSNVGCGLGTMLFQSNADDSSLLQAFQATTNGTFGNQTFGVTSGTSECKQPTKFVKNDRVSEFVFANLDDLAKDIANGKGETLDTLAELMGVPAAEREGFSRNLKAHFAEIFPGAGVEYAQVVDAIVRVSNEG